ncbi:Hypothetical predicted protein [Marmota monax]|uniref:Uncharacterized protein n=1 Tax=Marmota monax TaxID=9995 RepID=A0A5E4AN42_MARMO|nr:hypothetical protein GHT09_006467 [Marmota monax]VTJ57902.1 Hypothetical predicted protein [Marmota monax]
MRGDSDLESNKKELGRDLASQDCWPVLLGVLGARGRTKMPPPPDAQLRRTSKTHRRSWHSQPYFPTETVKTVEVDPKPVMESFTCPLSPLEKPDEGWTLRLSLALTHTLRPDPSH